MANHQPIFRDIDRDNLEAVKQRVLVDASVLEEKGLGMMTPLMYAVESGKPTIAHWIIEHRGLHDVNTFGAGMSALQYGCRHGPLSIVQALVTAGASPVSADTHQTTPLTRASWNHQRNIVVYLLQLPAVQPTIDRINSENHTALSYASFRGRTSIVQLLLDAGADPTIPAGQDSPLNRAHNNGNNDTAALLRIAIAEPDRARDLHKARTLLEQVYTARKAKQDARDKGETVAVQQQQAVTAAPIYLKGRVERDEPLPRVELVAHDDEQLRATVVFVVGLEGDGNGSEDGPEEAKHLPREVFKELLGYMMHAWADKGPEQEA